MVELTCLGFVRRDPKKAKGLSAIVRGIITWDCQILVFSSPKGGSGTYIFTLMVSDCFSSTTEGFRFAMGVRMRA